MPQITTQFLNSLDNRFRRLTLSSKSTIPLISDRILETKTTDRAYEQFGYIAGVGEAAVVPEGGLYPEKALKQGDSKTINVDKYGFKIGITRELVEDNQFEDFMSMVPRATRAAMSQTRERIALNLLNNGFDANTQTTPDGKALFATDHVLKQTGGAQANSATAAALDIDSLWTGLNLAKLTVSDAGLYDSIYTPKYLVVPQALERRSRELLKSELTPQITENQINAVRGLYDMEVLTSPLLTSTTAYFMLAKPSDVLYYGLICLNRENFNIHPLFSVKDAEIGDAIDKDIYSWRVRERYAMDVIHWNGTYGNAGA